MNHSMNVNPFSIGFDSLHWLDRDNLFARKAQLWDDLIRESIVDGTRYLERVVTRRNVKKVFREIYCKTIQ